jgi:prephenate dehydratase
MQHTETTTEQKETQQDGPLRVCIQGYAGAFHEIAARYCFEGQDIEVVPAHTFDQLVGLLESGEKVDTALMAIENTLAGSLMYNYDLLNKSKLQIVGEVYLRIKQNLMVLPGVKIEDLVEVHSHPIAIAQCREFFRQYPHIKLIETVDTALSAKLIREKGLTNVGAIASTLAAELYEMEILAAGIETNKKNHTRFLVLERREEAVVPEDADKVSLCFSVDHEVGSLYKVLAVLAAYNVNLTKIQSAPIIGKPWEYMFFLDFVEDTRVGYQQSIDAIKPLTHNLNVLGIYKKGGHFEY